MFDSKIFASRLHTARKAKGLTQQQLAKQLMLSTQAVSKWEQGKAVPDIFNLCSLADVLQTPLESLLGTTTSGDPALIGIDAGGSKTEFAMISLEGKLLRRVVLPDANPNTSGIENACDIFRQGIDALLNVGKRILAVCIGGAGMASGANADRTEAALRKAYPFLPIRCQSDIFNMLALANDPDNAIAIICGTGSVAYATKDGKLLRSGGAGWKLETLGSGYDIGRQTLHAALEARDNTGPTTALTAQVEQKLGGSVFDNIPKIYNETPAFIASFAPLALEAWQQGDAVATDIILANAKRLAALISAASEKSPKATQVLMGGSIFSKNEHFRKEVISRLDNKLQPEVCTLPQVWGACLCCAQLASVPTPDVNVFLSSYQQEE